MKSGQNQLKVNFVNSVVSKKVLDISPNMFCREIFKTCLDSCIENSYFLDTIEVEAEQLVNVMNEALDAINDLILYKMKCRLLKSYENHLQSVLVQSVSNQVKFNLTDENDEIELKNLEKSGSG